VFHRWVGWKSSLSIERASTTQLPPEEVKMTDNLKDAMVGNIEITHLYPIVKDITGRDVNFEKHLLLGSGCWCIPKIEIRNGDIFVIHNPRSQNNLNEDITLDGEKDEYKG
jgi:hypothetical protein